MTSDISVDRSHNVLLIFAIVKCEIACSSETNLNSRCVQLKLLLYVIYEFAYRMNSRGLEL